MTEAAAIPLASEIAPTSTPRIWGLVSCAGTGTRAGTSVPKQYQLVAGQTVIAHTLAALMAVARVHGILVVVAGDDAYFAAQLQARPDRWCAVACGGPTRARSVSNGLAALLERGAVPHDWVLVHDAARCLVLPEWIDRLIDACEHDPVGGLLAHPVPDTLKLSAHGRVVATADRSDQWLAQTPQMFRIGMLRDALLAARDGVTDESSAIEALGQAPKVVRGSALNFKLTHPEDFVLAQAVLLGRAIGRPRDHDYDYP